MIKRIQLTEDYSISRIIKGGWQLAGGHGSIDSEQAIKDMFAYYEAGVTTFDCADIYTGVEELIGMFLKRLEKEQGASAKNEIQVHTKYVPNRDDLGKLTKESVRHAIERSRKKLGVERIDLVQFHWWDFSIDQYTEVALMLQDLKQEGIIHNIGLTNFDAAHIDTVLDAGVEVLSNQVQYSVLDHRPEISLLDYNSKHNLSLFCYGTLAGGFVSSKYLGAKEPSIKNLESNRSLIKYKLIIDDLGGWGVLQELLSKLQEIGGRHDTTISETALLYLLCKKQVAAVILGLRNDSYVESLNSMLDKNLSPTEMKEIETIVNERQLGDIYELERHNEKHATIMKYNLNDEV